MKSFKMPESRKNSATNIYIFTIFYSCQEFVIFMLYPFFLFFLKDFKAIQTSCHFTPTAAYYKHLLFFYLGPTNNLF